MRPSSHRGFARGPHRGFHPRAVYARPGVFRRPADRRFDRGYGRPGYAPRYGLIAELSHRVYAQPVYGSTIAGPSPSLPLYNRPSCGCY